jgi:hypothetical protein
MRMKIYMNEWNLWFFILLFSTCLHCCIWSKFLINKTPNWNMFIHLLCHTACISLLYLDYSHLTWLWIYWGLNPLFFCLFSLFSITLFLKSFSCGICDHFLIPCAFSWGYISVFIPHVHKIIYKCKNMCVLYVHI